MTIHTRDGKFYETDSISCTLAGSLLFTYDGEDIVLMPYEIDEISD